MTFAPSNIAEVVGLGGEVLNSVRAARDPGRSFRQTRPFPSWVPSLNDAAIKNLALDDFLILRGREAHLANALLPSGLRRARNPAGHRH